MWLSPTNFIYRDAGHFYYPLYFVVADQWASGHWPLWNPLENAGTPLLANPASAVLYPVRIVIFHHLGLTYATAYKTYILFHAVLCGWGAWLLGRRLRLNHAAAVLAAIGYALAAPVLFQYSNVIFLVGAAWTPFGLLGTLRLVYGQSFSGMLLLATALAMQLLGGDPQAAYTTLLLTLLALAVRRPSWAVAALATAAAWATVAHGESELAAWLLGLTALVGAATQHWPQRATWRIPRRTVLVPVVAAVLIAAGSTAAQWIPTTELTARSRRAAERGGHSPYGFELPPWRLLEFIWPACFGRQFPENTRWIEAYYARYSEWLRQRTVRLQRPELEGLEQVLPIEYDPENDAAKYQEYIWVPSLYGSIVVVLLALAAFSLKATSAETRWLSWAALLLLVASLGRWAALYVFMVHGLPFFDTFRYPSKLLTPAALMIALLAGVGFEGLLSGRLARRLLRLTVATAGVSVLALGAWYLAREPLIQSWAGTVVARATSYYGPLQLQAAWRHTAWSLLHGTLVCVLFAVLLCVSRRRQFRPLALAVPALAAADVYLANAWLLVVAPQAEIDRRPTALQIIEADAARRGIGDGYRVYRAASFSPRAWWTTASSEREIEIFRWEKDTLQPKYGEIWQLRYVVTETTIDLYDYWWFFAPFFSNVQPGRVVYYPKRGYDLWGTRYLVLPTRFLPYDEDTGLASLAEGCEVVYRSTDPDEDYQVLFNPNAFPRAWLVHRVHYWPQIRGLRRADRMELMRRLLYPGPNRWWSERSLDKEPFDPRREAFVEADRPDALPQLEAPRGDDPEHCTLVREEAGELELEVKATARALVVVADVFYPGWRAYVDGRPTKIYRVNRIMRGVVVDPGVHRVLFRYEPHSFRLGMLGTQITLAAVALCGSAMLLVRGLNRLRRAFVDPPAPDST